jgi:hypothetical protein
MNIDQVRKLHRAVPFQPFEIHLADSRAFAVDHPELLTVVPPGRTIDVGSCSSSCMGQLDMGQLEGGHSQFRVPGRWCGISNDAAKRQASLAHRVLLQRANRRGVFPQDAF